MRELEIYAGRAILGIITERRDGWTAVDADLEPIGTLLPSLEAARDAVLAAWRGRRA